MNNPFLCRTPSIYFFAMFSRSASSPRSSKSSSVKGTQNGSSSSISNPAKTSCGDAAPDVRLRISSLKPKDSATGNKDWMVKNGVPSFMNSVIMRPRRRVMTPYTRPNTSAIAPFSSANHYIGKRNGWVTYSRPESHSCTSQEELADSNRENLALSIPERS